MKKSIVFLFLSIFFVSIFPFIKSHAETLNQVLSTSGYRDVFVCKVNDNEYRIVTAWYPASNETFHILDGLRIGKYNDQFYQYLNVIEFYASVNPLENPNTNFAGSTLSSPVGNFSLVICLKGSAINDSSSIDQYFESLQDYEDFINPPEPEPDPTWWEKLKENAQRVIRDIADILGIGSAFDSAIDLDNWLGDLFTVKVGEGELERWQIEVDPLPSPTPTPTPIPYQTVMTPDNNGGFTIQYIYNNPSGTPEAHPQPPANVTNTTNNYGDDFEYPYYENPENKDNPFRLKIPWYLKLILNNNDIPIETLDDHYDVAQYQVQSDDVLEAVDTVYDGFQVIPSDWILLLGAIACLPLFAALIHRMLSG